MSFTVKLSETPLKLCTHQLLKKEDVVNNNLALVAKGLTIDKHIPSPQSVLALAVCLHHKYF